MRCGGKRPRGRPAGRLRLPAGRADRRPGMTPPLTPDRVPGDTTLRTPWTTLPRPSTPHDTVDGVQTDS